ncbi:MAG: glycosyltransferase [Candidatus Binatia bacterium]
MGEFARLSVIVPVHNGADCLKRCLEALGRSTYRDYECIVVDDGSTDGTRGVAARHGVPVVALEHRGGPARARNRGAEHTRGAFLVFLDADVCVHTDTLSRIAAHFQEHPATDALIGSYDDAPADPGFISQYKNLFHHYVHQRSSTDAWTFWAGCGAIRRQVFLDAGGFDESYKRPAVEDIELGFRLRAGGRRIDLNPAIQVQHLKRWTFWGLVRTDLLDRGVPWFVLMLQHRHMPRDLNVRTAHRLSVVLVFAMMLLLVAIAVGAVLSFPGIGFGAVGLLGLASLLFILNYDLYRFFARKRSFGFALATLPLHWLYYAYCGLAVGLGMGSYLWRQVIGARQRPGLPCPGTTR